MIFVNEFAISEAGSFVQNVVVWLQIKELSFGLEQIFILLNLVLDHKSHVRKGQTDEFAQYDPVGVFSVEPMPSVEAQIYFRRSVRVRMLRHYHELLQVVDIKALQKTPFLGDDHLLLGHYVREPIFVPNNLVVLAHVKGVILDVLVGVPAHYAVLSHRLVYHNRYLL